MNELQDITISLNTINNTKLFSFIIDDDCILEFIRNSKNPQEQCKLLIHNGYLMSKCLPTSTLSCNCCSEIHTLKKSLIPITELFNTGGNSSKNGYLCEILMGDAVKKSFPSIKYIDTSGIDRNGDAVVSIDGFNIMIDYKNYNQPVPSSEVDKLVRDLKYRDISLGILYSVKSKISKKDMLDYEIIDGKLIVFVCGEGINPISLIMCIKLLLHLHKANVVSISDKVYELVNKSVGSKLVGLYEKIIFLKDSLQRHNTKIDETNEKLIKQIHALKEDTIHMSSHIMDIMNTINEVVENNQRESHRAIKSYEELVDIINRFTDKKKDITQCIQLLVLADEMNIQCGISLDKKHITLFKQNLEIGKLKITKSSATLIMYNLSSGMSSFHSLYEEIKHGNFHITLQENSELWNVIKYRFQ